MEVFCNSSPRHNRRTANVSEQQQQQLQTPSVLVVDAHPDSSCPSCLRRHRDVQYCLSAAITELSASRTALEAPGDRIVLPLRQKEEK